MIGLIVILAAMTDVLAGEMETVRQRVVRGLIAPGAEDGVIVLILRDQKRDGSFTGINYQDVSRQGWQHRIHLSHMLKLARVYQTKTSQYFHSPQVRDAIIQSLSYWLKNDFISQNWWHNQIGTPEILVSLNLIMGKSLPPDLVRRTRPIIKRANANAKGARPGADRIKILGIEAMHRLGEGDSEKFKAILHLLEEEIRFTKNISGDFGYGFRNSGAGLDTTKANGRGLQHDYSFHQRLDAVNTTLSYGISYADTYIEWALYTTGTGFAFSAKSMELLIDFFLNGISRSAIYGTYPDPGAKNRSFSRPDALKALPPAPAENLLKIKSSYRGKELRHIRDLRKGAVKNTISRARYFWLSDHFTVQRPGFFTSVRMYSTRVHNMEWPYNSEGLLNHHRGDGANHISVTGREYFNIAPVFDYQKIPGTTIVQKATLPDPDQIQKLGLTNFVGAVTDGRYGGVAFDFKSPHDPLVARKSWFFLENEYVCLGAGISSTAAGAVVTTIDQALLNGEVHLSRQGRPQSLKRAETSYDGVDWVHHANIGYFFPTTRRVTVKNLATRGSWWRGNHEKRIPREELVKDVFGLWIDLGIRPDNASYSYVIIPAIGLDQMKDYGKNRSMKILVNTNTLQAVEDPKRQLILVVFYRAGRLQGSHGLELIAHSPGVFMLKGGKSNLQEIWAADPTRSLDRMSLSINSMYRTDTEGVKSVPARQQGWSDISFALPTEQQAGRSVKVVLKPDDGK